MGGAESKEFKPTPSGRSPGRNPLQNLIRSFKKSPRPRKKSKDSQKSKKSTDSEASKDKQLKRQNSNVSKSDIAIDVNENPAEDSPPESERKEAVKVEEPEVTQKKGSLELDNVPSIDACSTLTPRSHDEIPVSTVFAEEKSRESDEVNKENDEIKRSKSTSSKGSKVSSSDSAKRKISRESAKSTSSVNAVKPATEADLAMATKLKKELEDTISELLAAASKAELYLSDEIEKEKMSKDDSDTIHLCVGQTRLLCQDKLGKQFRNLCLKTLGDEEIKVGETRPTADDLIGFWELVNIQVDSVRSQLGALHSKKDNDWKEPEKEVKTPPKPKKKTTPKTTTPRSAAASEKAKQRDAERKARLAAMRAKTKAAKKAEAENAEVSAE